MRTQRPRRWPYFTHCMQLKTSIVLQFILLLKYITPVFYFFLCEKRHFFFWQIVQNFSSSYTQTQKKKKPLKTAENMYAWKPELFSAALWNSWCFTNIALRACLCNTRILHSAKKNFFFPWRKYCTEIRKIKTFPTAFSINPLRAKTMRRKIDVMSNDTSLHIRKIYRDYFGSGSVYVTPDSGGECGVAYETYFPMPTPGKDKPWYSIEQASVHFTVISTEHHWKEGSEQVHLIYNLIVF